MNKRAIIVHGWGGHPEEGWRPWLRNELTQRGWVVEIPTMPNTDAPIESEWVRTINDAVGLPTPDTYLVGHSLGVNAILRYLEGLPPNRTIGGAVLVAGPTTNHLRIPEAENFFQKPLNWKSIRTHASNFVAIHSDNDGYVPKSDARVYQENLGATATVLHGMKHFSHDDGIRELPEVLDAVLGIAGVKS